MINTTLTNFSFGGKNFEIEIPTNDFMGKILSQGRIWEEHLLIFLSNFIIKKNLENNFCIFDIGANVGYHSIIVNNFFPCASVYAVEPHPEVIDILLRNRARYGGNFSVLPYAVGATLGSSNISKPDGSDSGDFHLSQEGISVDVTTIDAIAGKIGYPNFVKLDIQGLELDALMGAGEVISKKNAIFFVEFCPTFLNTRGCGEIEILKKIEEFGYAINIFRAHPVFAYEHVSADILINIFFDYVKTSNKGTFELLIIPS